MFPKLVFPTRRLLFSSLFRVGNDGNGRGGQYKDCWVRVMPPRGLRVFGRCANRPPWSDWGEAKQTFWRQFCARKRVDSLWDDARGRLKLDEQYIFENPLDIFAVLVRIMDSVFSILHMNGGLKFISKSATGIYMVLREDYKNEIISCLEMCDNHC